MPPTTTTACAVCTSRSRFAPAVTTEAGQPVCYFHASQDWRDSVVIAREMTGFIGWHEEQAVRHDGLTAEAKKPQSKDKNRALAESHRLAACAIKEALRRRVPAPPSVVSESSVVLESDSDDYDPR